MRARTLTAWLIEPADLELVGAGAEVVAAAEEEAGAEVVVAAALVVVVVVAAAAEEVVAAAAVVVAAAEEVVAAAELDDMVLAAPEVELALPEPDVRHDVSVPARMVRMLVYWLTPVESLTAMVTAVPAGRFTSQV